ncbi:hypothetical protein [Clostridium sp.]|uniref:hypothetical protein n=1 Tax=Clostridium sp. TaxID=1506 RepID=UPI002907562E|nr:hypothetical protein [Clostridium sp.]MDU3410156.1 hypothetical protein [Clostridium sp.]
MYCPKCDKLMKQTYVDYLNNTLCEQTLECECGVVYEFAYGAEIFLDNEGKEIKVNKDKTHMNIFEVFQCKVGTMFRIPETEEFEEEFVDLIERNGVKLLVYNDTGKPVSLSDAYLNSEYIKEN